MRARRIMAGFRRIGIVVAIILSLPLLVGLWTWVTLGHPLRAYMYWLLVAGAICALAASGIEWIAAGFTGEDESQSG